MQTAETDWTLSTAHLAVALFAGLGGIVIGAATAVWRVAARERGIDARFDAVEKDVAAVKAEAVALRALVGTLATRDDLREQVALVLTQLANIQVRVDHLHDRRED